MQRSIFRGQRVLHRSVNKERSRLSGCQVGLFEMETKPEASVWAGCVSARLVCQTVSVVTEQTSSLLRGCR